MAELGRLIPRALDPENPDRVEDLARIGRQAALLTPAMREWLLASVPGMGAEQVREALRPWLRAGVSARPAPADSIERAPDLGPFASGAPASSVVSAGPQTALVGSLAAASLERSPTPAVSSRVRAWPSVDGDRAFDPVPRADVSTAAPETSAADPAGEVAPQASYVVGERPVEAAWLAERETALVAIRADYEAAREQALAAPGVAPGWQPPFSQEIIAWSEGDPIYRPPVGRVVWLPDPDRPQELVGWADGDPIYRPVGRSVEFSEAAFAAHYRALGGEPLQRLAALYDPTGGSDAASLLAAHPELWGIATADHALNAGPPPPGFAMADAGQLGMLDLYLADPQIAALVDAYGGTPAPATGGVAIEQLRVFGQRRYEQMTRLANAMAAVRTQYADALAQAQRTGGGPGWVERELTGTDDISGQPWVVKYPAWDRDAFTDWYLAQGGPQHQAFAAFYGRSHTQFERSEDGRTVPSITTFDNPNWSLRNPYSTLGSDWVGNWEHKGLLSFDPNHPPALRDGRGVGFDFEAGWATPYGNLDQGRDWFSTAVQVAIVAGISYVSGGTLGKVAAGAMGGGAAGAAASAAVVSAAASLASGALSGNLTLKGVLQGALSGALGGRLMNSGLAESVNAAAGTAGTVALRMTVQGGIQELLGGSFSEGARAALAAGLADAAGARLKAGIDQSVATGAMSANEAIAARTFARVLGSAIRAAGNPDDPGYAFASDFLTETLQSVMASAEAQTPPATEATSEAPGAASAPKDDPFLAVSDNDNFGEVVRGFAEGAGFAVPDDGRASLLIRGVLLLSPNQAQALLGEEGVSRVRAEFQQAWDANDMRALGQLMGRIATDITRDVGGVDELARLGMGADSAMQRAVFRPDSDGGWFLPTAGQAVASGRAAGAPASGDQTKTYTYDDGSKLFDLGNGTFKAIPATEYQRAFAIDRFTQRARESTGRPAYQAAERVAEVSRILGPNGDSILAEALATGRMSVGLAGITASGEPRTPRVLDELRAELGMLIGRDLPAVLDNDNGPLDARVAAANPQQTTNVDQLLWLTRDAGITTDVVVHSNGVNALARSLQENPSFRLGEVRLIDVNVKGDLSQATEDLRRIVGASTRTTLVTTAVDSALAVSAAGDPTVTLIPAAAAAGVEYIRVLRGSGHGVDAVRAALERQGPEGELDFRRNDSGQVVPVNESAWRDWFYTWSNGRLQYNPWLLPRRGTLPRPSAPKGPGGREA